MRHLPLQYRVAYSESSRCQSATNWTHYPHPQETIVDVLSVVPSVLFVAFDLRLWGFLRFLRVLRWADIAPVVDSQRRKTTNARGDETTGAWDAKAEGALA